MDGKKDSLSLRSGQLHWNSDFTTRETGYLCMWEDTELRELYISKYEVLHIESLERPIFSGVFEGSKRIGEVEIDMKMTLRKERRGQKSHWYAYVKRSGVLRKLYAGSDDQLTTDVIVSLARRFNGIDVKS